MDASVMIYVWNSELTSEKNAIKRGKVFQ